MGKFKRGLSQAFIAALNAKYDQEDSQASDGRSWWRRLADDPELCLGIRDESLNVYHKGNSLLRLTYPKRSLHAEIHYKYLLAPSRPHSYITLVDGKSAAPPDETYFLHDLRTLTPARLKRASDPYTSQEKQGVHAILRSNPNIIDIEIAVEGEPKKEGSESKQKVKRIDFATLTTKPGEVEMVFFEAKLFANAELRSRGKKKSPVVDQIESYERLLDKHHEAIEYEYRNACANLIGLKGKGLSARLLAAAGLVCAGKPITVNKRPRLVIFGFDEDQRDGANWKRDYEKLVEQLGDDRVLVKGKPANFRAGISS